MKYVGLRIGGPGIGPDLIAKAVKEGPGKVNCNGLLYQEAFVNKEDLGGWLGVGGKGRGLSSVEAIYGTETVVRRSYNHSVLPEDSILAWSDVDCIFASLHMSRP
ncbi:Hypothetical predicted protein [Olea europaea subsp. europaea]|uniref:Uncharacterized protein n=1 Tax=Olea europaea subsp. europaea TaxID=158383 RepID=A0A8S0U256_OLEEU|nr:Hypothetical predicted protein [Olea europaea subsp. europaea]